MNSEEIKNKKVSWTIFAWALGIILLLFTIVFGVMAGLNDKVDNSNSDVVEMKVDIGVIKTDVGWIKGDYQELKIDIGSIMNALNIKNK